MRKVLLMFLISSNISTAREIKLESPDGEILKINDQENMKAYNSLLLKIHDFKRFNQKKKIPKKLNCQSHEAKLEWEEIKNRKMKLCLKIPLHAVYFQSFKASLK